MAPDRARGARPENAGEEELVGAIGAVPEQALERARRLSRQARQLAHAFERGEGQRRGEGEEEDAREARRGG